MFARWRRFCYFFIGLCCVITHGIDICTFSRGPFNATSLMDLLNEKFGEAMGLRRASNCSQSEAWFRMAKVAFYLLSMLGNSQYFEPLFQDCAPLYFVGYAMIALSDPGSKQEYAIKALRFGDLVAHRQGAWCSSETLTAFRQRWSYADTSSQYAVELAGCGAPLFPNSWAGYLRWVCNHVGSSATERQFLSPQHPYPWSAWVLCSRDYFILPALDPSMTLEEFHALVAPRLSMVATPLWSQEVLASCLPEWGCASQSHYMLLEALRHVVYNAASLFLEFGVFKGRSANLTARFLQAKARELCGSSDDGTASCRPNDPPLVYAFDSFKGLPREWFEHSRADFDCYGKIPNLEPNVRPVVGWFNESLPKLSGELRVLHKLYPTASLAAAFVHVDCDLYGSTLDALIALQRAGLLTRNTVVAFDELVHHASAYQEEGGELAALHQLLIEHPRQIEVLAGAWRRSSSHVGGFGAIRLLA